ncbi:MAG TPA: sigma-54 dependent transcriptional regulator [Terriglobales bacterium]|nr:sigma-54 dependent transcriptional regulator [Terriglobales bacterium]
MRNIKNGSGTILLGEDELEVRSYLEMALRCQGYSVEMAQDGEELLSCLRSNTGAISAVLLDLIMPRKDGFETLKEIRRIDKDLPIIVISGASSPLNVVEAMKSGATDFLGKPISPEDLRQTLKGALEKRADASSPALASPEKPAAISNKQVFLGGSPQMREIQGLLRQIGWSEVPVLIQGETGVGKEVLARGLHAESPRANGPFLKLNCAALPSELVESELFGYERGAFTGAFQRKPGMFELADGGTLLLDEIGDMEFKLQAKLLQVLQDQEFQRLGGKDTVQVDVRVLAATHQDLEKAIVDRRFREDLYYRLNVINLRIPALRERKEDVIAFTEFLLKKHTPKGVAVPVITDSLKQALLLHNWPGNIRELENVVRKFVVLRDPELIAAELNAKATRKSLVPGQVLPPIQEEPSENESTILQQVSKAKHKAEATAIMAALNSTRWNRKQAAALLKIDYKALLYKMKKLSIEDKVLSFDVHGTSAQDGNGERALVGSAGAS